MSALSIEVHDHVGWFTLNRPGACNAINQELLMALDKAFIYAKDSRSNIRCIVLTGAGTHFCGGIDLRSMQSARTDSQNTQGIMKRRFVDHLIERLLSLRLPIVAAVNGAAAGAGMTLALTADVIVMAEDAYFLPSFLQLGLVPDNGITCLLSERIGAGRARAALMLGDRIGAKTAQEWGLAYEVVPPEVLQRKAGEFATRLASGPPRALAGARALLCHPVARGFRTQIQAEREACADALVGDEFVEGCAAFFEHREPKF